MADTIPETALYLPVKAFLQAQGYTVKGEVGACDVLACQGDDESPLVVELKSQLTLDLLLQAVDRLQITDLVYVAIPAPVKGIKGYTVWQRRRRPLLKLLRRLGLGLLLVHRLNTATERIEVVVEPQPYQPRKNRRRQRRLLGEFKARRGDPNLGGQTGRRIMTAYRQDAVLIAKLLADHGPSSPAAIRTATGIQRAAGILQRNHYGWFERVRRGVYCLNATGKSELGQYASPEPAAASQN